MSIDQKVTGITISATSAYLTSGSTSISATASPASATNKNINWASSNTAVTTVSKASAASGTAITLTYAGNLGTALITATAADGSGAVGSCKINPVISFGYTGGVQGAYLTPATYTLQAWGACAGYALCNKAVYDSSGKGGYSVGNYTFSNHMWLYAAVGGRGTNGVYRGQAAGGWNGGGLGGWDNSDDEAASGGGGATHFSTTNRGVLANFNSYRGEVLMVAGAEGGRAWHGNNGWGGGLSGGPNDPDASAGKSADQSTGYAFGTGQPGYNSSAANQRWWK